MNIDWRSLTVALPISQPQSEAWDCMGRIIERRYPGADVSAQMESEEKRGATVFYRFMVYVGSAYRGVR